MEYTKQAIETLLVDSGARSPDQGKYVYTFDGPFASQRLLVESTLYFKQQKGDVRPRRVAWVYTDAGRSLAVVVDLPQPNPSVVKQLKDLHQRGVPDNVIHAANRLLYLNLRVMVVNVDPAKDGALFATIQGVLQDAYHATMHWQGVPIANPTPPRFYEAVIRVMNAPSLDALNPVANDVMAWLADPMHTDAFLRQCHQALRSGKLKPLPVRREAAHVIALANQLTLAPLLRRFFSSLPRSSLVMPYQLEVMGMLLGVMMSVYLGFGMVIRNLCMLMMAHGVSMMQRQAPWLSRVPRYVLVQCFMVLYGLYEVQFEDDPQLSTAMLLVGTACGLMAVALLDSQIAASPDGQAKQMAVSMGASMMGQLAVACLVQYMWVMPMLLRREHVTKALETAAHRGDIERLNMTFVNPDVDWWSQSDEFTYEGYRGGYGFFAYRCVMDPKFLTCEQTVERLSVEGV